MRPKIIGQDRISRRVRLSQQRIVRFGVAETVVRIPKQPSAKGPGRIIVSQTTPCRAQVSAGLIEAPQICELDERQGRCLFPNHVHHGVTAGRAAERIGGLSEIGPGISYGCVWDDKTAVGGVADGRAILEPLHRDR